MMHHGEYMPTISTHGFFYFRAYFPMFFMSSSQMQVLQTFEKSSPQHILLNPENHE
jgi:hypothetical protein